MYRNVVICKQTDKAILVKFVSSKKTEWFPKSRINIIDKKENSFTGREIYQIEILK